MEKLDPSQYVGKIMTYQAYISHRATTQNVPSRDDYCPVEWSDSATIQRAVDIYTPNGVVTYFQSKEHPMIWIRFDDKIGVS